MLNFTIAVFGVQRSCGVVKIVILSLVVKRVAYNRYFIREKSET